MHREEHQSKAPAVMPPPFWSDEDADGLPRAGFRGSGFVALVGVVLLGLLPATYYMWARPRMERAYAAEIKAAPTTSRGRLEKWFEFGAAMIHHRIVKVGRFSDEYPWIVAYAIRGEGDVVQAFGLDASKLTPGFCRLDDLTVVVDLPAPGPLGPMSLAGERGRYVPVIESGALAPDATLRLRELTLWFLEDLPTALARDIEGASLELRIDGIVVVPRKPMVPAEDDASPAPAGEIVQPAGSDGR